MNGLLIVLFVIGAAMAAHGRNRGDVGYTTLGVVMACAAISAALVADLTGVPL